MSNYYHAGSQDENNDVRWSDSTRRTAEAAEKEAKQMAKKHGGKPIVEYWDRKCGLCPGDCEVVAGAYNVE